MVPLWRNLLLTNFYVMRISFCHTNINIFRLAQKSSSKLLSRAKHELEIYIFGGKAIERAGAPVPTTGTVNEKRRTLKKPTVSSPRFVDNIYVPLWRSYAKKREKMSDKICEAWLIFSLKRKTFFFTSLQAESFLKSRKQPTFRDATSFHAKWRLKNVPRKSVLMTCQYPDLGSASEWLRHISHDQSEALLRYG